MTTPTRPAAAGARGTWGLRDRPGVMWLVLAVLVALAHPFVPESTWLMVHLVLLGALTHSVMVWSTHFTQALLKTPPGLDDRSQQSRRLLLLLAGTALVLVGVPMAWWPVTVTGATAVSAAVVWHAVQLWRRLRKALPARFRISVRYYVLAAAWLPVGATLGVLLARGPDDAWHGRLLVAHSMAMILGWIGLTVTGTLVTLWPTMLRTRIDDRAEALAHQALPAFVGAVAVVVVGALTGLGWLTAAGLVGYLAALAWWGRAPLRPALTRPPREVSTLSVTAALVWLVVALTWVVVLVARGEWARLDDDYVPVAAVLAVGFAAQLLTGALSYLIPSVLGGGPSVVRAGQGWFERLAGTRLAVVNVGLLLSLLPVPSAVRIACSVLVLVALAAFVPLMFGGIRASVAARRALAAGRAPRPEESGQQGPEAPAAGPRPDRRPRLRAQATVGLAAIALAVTAGVAADPSAVGLVGPPGEAATLAAGASVAPTGHTTRVRVTARDMRFEPDTVEVPFGDRLVVELVNADPRTTHDLTFGDGVHTPRLRPGERAELDVGVVSAPADGWCSVVGHRMRGMTLRVEVTGAPAGPGDPASHAGAPGQGAAPAASAPGQGSAALPPADLAGTDATTPAVGAELPPLGPGTTHRVTLNVTEATLEVAPGVWQRRWTYDGRVPGPTLHGRVGDTFVVTLVNDAGMGHSIDFHAGERAPGEVMRTIPPGGTLTYTFTARRAGIWMYHCSTAPMSAHIASGMFGAVVIEPPDLPSVDNSYVLVQSEAYLDTAAGTSHEEAGEVDAEKVAAERPDAVTFNGRAFQYDRAPLAARVGERVRLWVLDAGPNRATSFHVVGGQFDTVWAEGAHLLRQGRGAFGGTDGGSQALALGVAQGGFVELSLPEAGDYPFVSHVMVDAERGAHGLLRVTR
jgi:nitrite reductase (NO-forming)